MSTVERPYFVYRCFDYWGSLLYIGCTCRPHDRLRQHVLARGWQRKIRTTTWEGYPDRDTSRAAEREAIVRERPPHNVNHTSPRKRAAA